MAVLDPLASSQPPDNRWLGRIGHLFREISKLWKESIHEQGYPLCERLIPMDEKSAVDIPLNHPSLLPSKLLNRLSRPIMVTLPVARIVLKPIVNRRIPCQSVGNHEMPSHR